MRYTKLVLGVLIVIGIFLRFYQIALNSLWLDEVATLMISKTSFLTIWNFMLNGEFNPPLFYWIEHVVITFFGTSEMALRFIPAVAGVCTIPIIYYLGKEVMDEKVGLISAFLIVISPWHIVYSQEARAYTLALLFFSLALLYFIKLLKNRSAPRADMILFAILASVAVWCHFYVLVFIAVLFCILLIHYRSVIFLSIFTFVIISFPLLIPIFSLTRMRAGLYSSQWGTAGIGLLTNTINQLFGFNTIIVIIMICMVILGVIVLYKDKIILISLLCIILIPLTLSVIISPYINLVPRYLCYLLPALWVVCAAFYKIFNKVKNRINFNIFTIFLLVCCILFSALTYHDIYTIYRNPDWRGASDYLKNTAQNGDYIILIPSATTYGSTPLDYYYNNESQGTILLNLMSVDELMGTINISAHKYYVISNTEFGYIDKNNMLIPWIETTTKCGKNLSMVTICDR